MLIHREEKMADILKNDVQTYVRELISKEFESINNEDNAPSDNRKLNDDEYRNGQNRSVWNCSLKVRTTGNLGE